MRSALEMEHLSSSQLTAHCVGHRSIDLIKQREHVAKSPGPISSVLIERYPKRMSTARVVNLPLRRSSTSRADARPFRVHVLGAITSLP